LGAPLFIVHGVEFVHDVSPDLFHGLGVGPPPRVARVKGCSSDPCALPNVEVRLRKPFALVVVSVDAEVGSGFYELHFGKHLHKLGSGENAVRRGGRHGPTDGLRGASCGEHSHERPTP